MTRFGGSHGENLAALAVAIISASCMLYDSYDTCIKAAHHSSRNIIPHNHHTSHSFEHDYNTVSTPYILPQILF